MIWRCDLLPQYEQYKDEIDRAISRVLNSGRYILADEVAAFEEEFAAFNKVKYAVGVANGTDALILPLKAFEVGKGDEVITTPFTAIPTISAIMATGATPVFLDVCKDTFLLDLTKIEKLITAKTKAIIPVHIFGNVVNVPKLKQIAGKIPIIEDACQAHGSKLNGAPAGSMGELGAFSFYPTKNLGGYGDGGAIITNNKGLAEKLKLLRMYGMSDKDHTVIPGINSRLDELQAAILRVKLKYLDDMNVQRNKIARRYIDGLNAFQFDHQRIEEDIVSNYHLFESRYKGNRDALIRHLSDQKIQTNIYYVLPHHLQESLKFLGYKQGDLPVIESLCQEVISLPLYPEMDARTQDIVIKAINSFKG